MALSGATILTHDSTLHPELVALDKPYPQVATFRELTEDLRFRPKGEVDDRTLQLWIEEMRRLWVGPDPWRNSDVLALLQLAQRFDFKEDKVLDGARRDLVLEYLTYDLVAHVSTNFSLHRFLGLVAEANLTPEQWSRIIDIGLARSLEHGITPTPETMGPIRREVYKVRHPETNPYRPRVFGPDRFLGAARTWILNRTWELYKGQPIVDPVAPLSRQEMANLAQQPTDDLFAIARNPRLATWEEEQAEVTLVGCLLLMELRGYLATGRPLPERWDELRPALRSIVVPRAEWYALRTGGVSPELQVYPKDETLTLKGWPIAQP